MSEHKEMSEEEFSEDEEVGEEEGFGEEEATMASPYWSHCRPSGTPENMAICNHCNLQVSTKYKTSQGKVERVRLHFNINRKGVRLPNPKSKKRNQTTTECTQSR
jgi:hypothetical protein